MGRYSLRDVVKGPSSKTALANYKIIGKAIDWLSGTVRETLSDEQLSGLLRILEGHSEPFETDYLFMGRRLYASSAGNVVFKLHCKDWFDFSVLFKPSGPVAQCTVYSEPLWTNVHQAIEEMQLFCDNIYGAPVAVLAGRVDMCTDVVGFELDAMSADDVIRRRVFVSRFRDVKLHAPSARLETLYLGSRSGAVMLRMYDKTAEVMKTGKRYYEAVWSSSGWSGYEQRITRIEFELKRAFWRGWQMLGNKPVETIWDMLEALNGVWQYLTVQHTRMVVYDASETNVSRLPSHALWSLISSVVFQPDASTLPGERYTRHAADVSRLDAQIAGLLRSRAALTPDSDSFGMVEYAQFTLSVIRQVERKKKLPFAELVRLRRAAIFSGMQKKSA